MLPTHLAQINALGTQSGEPIAQFEIGDYKNFVYLILDWKNREAAVVDPQKDLRDLLSSLKQNGFSLKAILLTHTHFDHIAGVGELVERFPEIPILVHEADLRRLDLKIRNEAKIKKITDEEIFKLGSLRIQVLHTPGHSAGECSYFIDGTPPYLFTGDTVFIRDCGRTDLESGSNDQMFASLQKLKQLPGNTVILPGHHYAKECASTLERELKDSAPFKVKSVAELASLP